MRLSNPQPVTMTPSSLALVGPVRTPPPHRPFIPAWLDDLRLSAPEFRVLCHLWRRADKNNRCFPGATEILLACKISKNTLWRILNELEQRGLIQRRRSFRNSNTYTLIVPRSISPKEGVTGDNKLPQSEGRLSAQNRGRESTQSEGSQSPQKEGQEGIPIKGIQRREYSEGVRHTPSAWPVEVPVHIAGEIANGLNISVHTVQAGYTEFRGKKLAFNDKPPPRQADIWEAVRAWLKASKEGRALRDAEKTQRAVAEIQHPEPIEEPAEWRTTLSEDDEDRRNWGCTKWENILDFYQRRIVKTMEHLNRVY